jgi:Rieske 2Fe-2S family protein
LQQLELLPSPPYGGEWKVVAMVMAPARVAELVSARRSGYSLPQDYYVDPDVLELDLEHAFARQWLFVAASGELPLPGDVLTWSVGRESVLVTRDLDGSLSAHHNVCRHRGCRLRTDGPGSARVVVCPYHQWSYGLDGRLRGAPHMGAELARETLGLRPVHLRDLGGLLFVCFADEPPGFDPAVEVVEPQLRLHEIARTRVAARQHYRVQANWKLLVENNRECYHCRVNHPEFCLSNFDVGVGGDLRHSRAFDAALAEHWRRWVAAGLAPRESNFEDGGFFRVARLPLRPGYVTESLTGRLIAPVLGRLPSPDVGSLRLITLPNSWTHVNADYAVTTRLTPIAPDRTDVAVTFLVREDAVEGRDYSVPELTAVWQATSEQDWSLCEQSAAGVRSRGYLPGPLSPVTEGSVGAFHEWYLRVLPNLSPAG